MRYGMAHVMTVFGCGTLLYLLIAGIMDGARLPVVSYFLSLIASHLLLEKNQWLVYYVDGWLTPRGSEDNDRHR
ncbi:hypothetical protein LCM20_06430 [Halobacillus litoralis]|uniref:hypothetical protein n=1 Tax=Halobacillus litoralis TaxID=45668 RepID=UPI001CD43CA8|nr:hypothetical protein [Halobacillus litoralis]MCA0970217.1 hypothetical protein [Halobacillus litoralis]